LFIENDLHKTWDETSCFADLQKKESPIESKDSIVRKIVLEQVFLPLVSEADVKVLLEVLGLPVQVPFVNN
jgi:hypothetical protein